MEGIRVIKDYKINLVNLTPLKIGNGKDELDLLIDKNTKKPIILGSSIAQIRRKCKQKFAKMCSHRFQ